MAIAVAAIAKQVNIAADALWAIAVVAHAIIVAWGADVETLSIDGRRGATSARNSILHCRCHFV